MWPIDDGNGGFAAKTRLSNGTTAVALSDGVIRVNAASGAAVVSLLAAALTYDAARGIGAIFTIKKVDASANIVSVLGATIDGFAQVDLTAQNETMAVQSNGTTYDILFRSQ